MTAIDHTPSHASKVGDHDPIRYYNTTAEIDNPFLSPNPVPLSLHSTPSLKQAAGIIGLGGGGGGGGRGAGRHHKRQRFATDTRANRWPNTTRGLWAPKDVDNTQGVRTRSNPAHTTRQSALPLPFDPMPYAPQAQEHTKKIITYTCTAK